VSSFQTKELRVTFTLGQGGNTFPGTTSNQLVLTGLRTIATISGAFGFLTQLDLEVYGMRSDDMNALSVITGVPGFPTAIGKNQVLLEGNQGSGWFTLFNGLILEGGPEYRQMPEVFYHCQAVPAPYFQGIGTSTPLSYPSGAQVSQVASDIASTMGMNVQNNGVTGSVPKGAYFPGAPLDQLKQLSANSGQFAWTIDPANTNSTTGTLVLMAKNQPRTGGTSLTLSPTSGLIGYPTIESFGIGIVALFDPALLLGAQFAISGSDIPAANGTWMAYQLSYQLEQLAFGGQWFAAMHCMAPG